MFRLPFAAGRVFSISMLDTLLYQVGTHLQLKTLNDSFKYQVKEMNVSYSSTVETSEEQSSCRAKVPSCVQSFISNILHFPYFHFFQYLKHCINSSVNHLQTCNCVSCNFIPVFREGLHDPYCKTAPGTGHNSRIRISLRCELWKKITLNKKLITKQHCIFTLLIFLFASDESKRGGSVDWYLWKTFPETLLL